MKGCDVSYKSSERDGKKLIDKGELVGGMPDVYTRTTTRWRRVHTGVYVKGREEYLQGEFHVRIMFEMEVHKLTCERRLDVVGREIMGITLNQIVTKYHPFLSVCGLIL